MAVNPQAVGRWLAEAVGAHAVSVTGWERLGGGAIQENFGLDVTIEGGRKAGAHRLVLRRSAGSVLPVSWSRAQEFAILRVAHRAGVTVPEPWALCTDEAMPGAPFFVMARAMGEARGARLVRDPAIRATGEDLIGQVAREMARLHRVRPPVPELAFMAVPGGSPGEVRIAEYRRHLDALDAVEPTLEWALSWLAGRVPGPLPARLIHGDFRTGNFLVSEGRLTAVLDWEFAIFGDPREDLGWMLARFWRFGAYEREAGGIASREALLAAYEAASGEPLDRRAVAWWEVMASVRWAVIALLQADRHQSGAESSLELALTAHVLPLLELDLLRRIAEWEAGV